MAMTEYIEYFEEGVMLTYTSEAPMTDAQRTQFMALMPITLQDTDAYTHDTTKGAVVDTIFGCGNWACSVCPSQG